MNLEALLTTSTTRRFRQVGIAWSPNAKNGFLEKFLGGGSATVIRGGFGVAYNNYGMGSFDSMFYSNPGGTVDTSRSETLGNLRVGGLTYPILFRNRKTIPGMLDPAPYPTKPAYPIAPPALKISDSMNAFEPGIKTPYTMSWQFWHPTRTRQEHGGGSPLCGKPHQADLVPAKS